MGLTAWQPLQALFSGSSLAQRQSQRRDPQNTTPLPCCSVYGPLPPWLVALWPRKRHLSWISCTLSSKDITMLSWTRTYTEGLSSILLSTRGRLIWLQNPFCRPSHREVEMAVAPSPGAEPQPGLPGDFGSALVPSEQSVAWVSISSIDGQRGTEWVRAYMP